MLSLWSNYQYFRKYFKNNHIFICFIVTKVLPLTYKLIHNLKFKVMATYKLPYSDTEITIRKDGVITRVNGYDHICNIIEMKLCDYRLKDLEDTNKHFFPYWLDMFIQEIGASLPETNEQFEKIVKKNWSQWGTKEVRVGNQLDHYQFGDEHMAHDMKDYYGVERANGKLFQRRYDFAIADIEVRIKSEQYV